jgi:hypothetical protein
MPSWEFPGAIIDASRTLEDGTVLRVHSRAWTLNEDGVVTVEVVLSHEPTAHEAVIHMLVPQGSALIDPGRALDVIEAYVNGTATWQEVERAIGYT